MSHVLVPLAQGCEELEAITIVDLLVRAGIKVTTVGLDDSPVTASRGTRIIPDTSIDKVLDTEFDLVVLPGGLPVSLGQGWGIDAGEPHLILSVTGGKDGDSVAIRDPQDPRGERSSVHRKGPEQDE